MNKRVVSMVSFSFAVLLFGACEKPSESECKKAVTNIRQIMGTSKMSIDGAQDAAWVRSCRGTAKKTSVSCAIAAKSLDGLKTCGLLKGADLDELMQIEADLKKLHDTANGRMISEWAKKAECWTAVKGAAYSDPSAGIPEVR